MDDLPSPNDYAFEYRFANLIVIKSPLIYGDKLFISVCGKEVHNAFLRGTTQVAYAFLVVLGFFLFAIFSPILLLIHVCCKILGKPGILERRFKKELLWVSRHRGQA